MHHLQRKLAQAARAHVSMVIFGERRATGKTQAAKKKKKRKGGKTPLAPVSGV